MATPADLLAAVAAAVEALVPGIVRLGSDYRTDLEAIPAGASRYQLRGSPGAVDGDSNATAVVEAVQVLVFHRLADPLAERAYTEAAMQTTAASLISPAWWRAIANVLELDEAPQTEVQRVGSVIELSAIVSVSVTP